MGTFRSNQTSFAAGMIGGLLRGRVDLQQYPAAAEELTNVRVLTSGAATRRPGSYFVATPPATGRLRRFRVSGAVAYMLLFGADGAIRVFRNRAPVLDSGAAPISVAHPYAAGDLAQLSFAQSADTLYIFHPSHQPRKLRRTSANAFELALAELVQGPYDVENFGDVPPPPTPPAATAPEDSAPPPAPGGDGSGDGPDPRQGNIAEGGGANGGEGSASVDPGNVEWGGGELGGDVGGEIGPGDAGGETGSGAGGVETA